VRLDTPLPIHWDDSRSRTLRPAFCSVSATREEVSLLFGAEEPVLAGSGEVSIPLSERIVLGPTVAKKLASLLKETLCKFEPVQPSRPEPSLSAPERADGFSLIREKKSSKESADLLWQLTRDLGVSFESEKSFKIVPGKILTNRFLLGIGRKNMPGGDTRIFDLCGRIGMPENLQKVFRSRVAEANFVHFGFEENERTCIYKVYLEFLDRVREEIKNDREDRAPRLLHLAFKWDVSENTRQAVTSYTLYPWLSISEMISRACNTLKSKAEDNAINAIVEGVIRLAAERISPDDLLYLEVTEEGNPRTSFDINMYRARLHVAELYPWLGRIARRLGISYRDFHDQYEPLKNERLGHLAGGIGRDGKEFFTIYYGAENVRFNSVGVSALQDDTAMAPAFFPDHIPIMIHTTSDGGFLIDLVKGLKVPFGIERSFKIANGTLLADRFLLGFQRKAAADKEERILKICYDLKMPVDFFEVFRTNLPQANILLFGYDGNPTTPLYKAYLELSSRLGDVVPGRPETLKPFPIHLGFKWGVQDPSQKIRAYYNCFPLLPINDMLKRVSDGFYSTSTSATKRIVEDILALAASRTRPDGLLYVETNEGDNPRSSFDVNLYRANLRVMEVYPYLLAMVRHYSVPVAAFHCLYERTKGLILGHLTGGVDRQGRDFLTVYFSEMGSTREPGT
jgi:hypothetical protein